MRNLNRLSFTLLLLLTISAPLFAQHITVEGHIQDTEHNPVIFATVYLKGTTIGCNSDENGYFKFSIPQGEQTIVFSAVGYKAKQVICDNKKDLSLNILLEEQNGMLEEINITASRPEEELQNRNLGVNYLKGPDIQRLPGIAGEADIFKIAQLMPGITKGMEAGSDLFVRGGGADQNLIMLDNAVVYQPNHLINVFSTFNPDVVGGMTLMKGAFPAKYGGRVSSIMDIETINPANEDYTLKGSLGLISSRLTLRHTFKDKFSVMASGRRTYMDKVMEKFGLIIPYYFYDYNIVTDYKISDSDRISFSLFSNHDQLIYQEKGPQEFKTGFSLRNLSTSVNWKHALSGKHFSNISLAYSRFGYDATVGFNTEQLNVTSSLQDLGLKLNMSLLNGNHNIDYGAHLNFHQFLPNQLNMSQEMQQALPDGEGRLRNTYEMAIYGQGELNFTPDFTLNTGLRLSGMATQSKTYIGYEPRLNLSHRLGKNGSLKVSYTRMQQYIHRLMGAAITLPTDMWYPVSEKVKPQIADQIALGYIQKFPKKSKLQIELFYKRMQNLIEFKEGTDLTLNNSFEEHIVQGQGDSYGTEFLLKKDKGKLTGWISYTISWAHRQFEELNHGMPFASRYDRRHNFSSTLMYQLSPRLSISSNWAYLSGARFTPLTGQYAVPDASMTNVELIPIYTPKNAIKLPDTHHLDFSLTLYPKEGRKFKGTWQLSLYNVYNRAIPYQTVLAKQPDGTRIYKQEGLFGFLPSISYSFEL